MHALAQGEGPEQALGTVASEERSALIGAPANITQFPSPAPEVDTSDATQQLLTCLGRFQRELGNAGEDGTSVLWADECMNQLIDCVEVALPHGWSEMVEALADTGRVLQTYENAGKPEGCLEFLNDAYEILCLMVGDLIVDDIRASVIEQWRERYERAVGRLESAGMTLVSDSGEEPPAVEDAPAIEDAMPFDMPADDANGPSVDEEPLPTLDELPPLETILNGAPSTPPSTEAAAPAAPETPEVIVEPADEAPDEVKEPAGTPPQAAASRLVVEILDQLCAQLSTIETGSPDARDHAITRLVGGARALHREARDHGHATAAELCDRMVSAVEASAAQTGYEAGLSELGYAFCGAYMDALRGDDNESIDAWMSECDAFVRQWPQETSEAGENADAIAQAVEEIVEETQVDEPVFEPTDEPVQDVSAEDAIHSVVPGEKQLAREPEVAVADEVTVADEVAPEAIAEAEVVEEVSPPEEDTSSAGLLAAAQRAATAGDAAGAKRFALQAAGAIARDEVETSTSRLAETKDRLKAGLESTKVARTEVKDTEEAVKAAASRVSEGESALGKAKENAAQVEQTLSDLRSGVADLERQIAELQARREEELLKVADSEENRERALNDAAAAERELDERRIAEEEERAALELRRQKVSELQRTADEIEAEVDSATTVLEEKQKSFDDITEAIRQICGDAGNGESNEGLLF